MLIVALLLLVFFSHFVCPEPDPEFFPQQFSVVVGTTIAQTNFDAIAHSGNIYFDYQNQRMRIDNWFLDTHHTFLALYADDYKKVYFVSNGKCTYSKVSSGSLLPYDLPPTSIKHAEPQIVRGGFVTHYEAVVPSDTMLQRVDFYVKQVNITQGRKPIHIPWRTVYERSRRRELEGVPQANGDMETDVSFSPFGSEVTPPDLVRQVVSDYYNFLPLTPDETLFRPPPICDRAKHDIFKGMEDPEQVFSTQKRLVDISLFEGDKKFLQPPPEPAIDDTVEDEGDL